MCQAPCGFHRSYDDLIDLWLVDPASSHLKDDKSLHYDMVSATLLEWSRLQCISGRYRICNYWEV
jgi:hypothetical protein